MSAEQVETQSETTDSSTVSNENVSHETIETQEQPKEENKSSHAPYVDLSTLPEDIRRPLEDRFTHLSRLMKKQEVESNQRMNEWRSLAQEQAKQIDDLMNGVGRVVDHLQQKNAEETEEQIRDSMMKAWEAGDVTKYHSEQERLLDIKAQKQAQKLAQKPQQNQQKQEDRNYSSSASQVASEAIQSGEIPPEVGAIVSAWESEIDETGRPLRPWAKNTNPNRPDPDFVKAALIAQQVWEENPYRSPQENLSEVDRRMGLKKQTAKQTVMGGSLTTPARQNRMTLSPELQKLAVRTKFGGPNAKSDAEHIDAYRKQLEKVKSSKGSR